MKKAIMITLLSVVFMVSLSACSSNWKEGSSGITEEELFEELDSMSAFSTASNGAGSGLYNELKDKPDTKRYFARSGDNSNGGLGPAYSVVSFGDFSPFGVHKEISIYDLESAKVALLDGFDSQDQRRFVLAVNYQTKDGDSVTYYAEDAGFEFGKTKLQIQVNQGDRTYILETFDIVDGEEDLTGYVHLKMIEILPGEENILGQFSYLEGFGK